MATINLEFGKPSQKGERKVYFLIQSGNSKKRIPTTVKVTASDMSRNGKDIKDTKKAFAIESIRRKLQDKLYEMSYDLTADDVDARYIAEHIKAKHKEELDFFKFADEWIERSPVKGKKNYITFLNNLERHLGRRMLSFTEITYSMLQDYEDSLKNKPRAMTLYLGSIRHLYREAMRQYNTDYEQPISNDPFLRYRVPKQKMAKGVRALSLEELMKIYEYDGTPGTRPQLARDCFILSFCLMGMNSVDMYECDNCKDNVLRYNRAKTKDRRSDGAYIEVAIHPFVKKLMKKYKGKVRVFNFYKRYASAQDFNQAVNKGLKKIGKDVGINNLQFYQARHTFATLSRNLMKFSKSDVDEALNHVGTMDIADIYIKKDFSIINENNKKLIEEVFKDFL